MAALTFTNFAESKLAADITDTSPTLRVQDGDGSKFPAQGDFFAVLSDGLNSEIVRCTARNGDVLTVTRGQDGTTALPWAAGTEIRHTMTAATAAEMVQKTQAAGATYDDPLQIGGTYFWDDGAGNTRFARTVPGTATDGDILQVTTASITYVDVWVDDTDVVLTDDQINRTVDPSGSGEIVTRVWLGSAGANARSYILPATGKPGGWYELMVPWAQSGDVDIKLANSAKFSEENAVSYRVTPQPGSYIPRRIIVRCISNSAQLDAAEWHPDGDILWGTIALPDKLVLNAGLSEHDREFIAVIGNATLGVEARGKYAQVTGAGGNTITINDQAGGFYPGDADLVAVLNLYNDATSAVTVQNNDGSISASVPAGQAAHIVKFPNTALRIQVTS